MSEIPSVPQRVGALTLAVTHEFPRRGVLIVSGFMEDDRVRDRNEIEDFHIFPKPFGRDELLKKVNEVLLEIRKRDLQRGYSKSQLSG